MARLHNKTVQAALNEVIKTGRVSEAVGKPLLDQGLISVDVNDVVNDLAAAALTDKGKAGMPVEKATGTPTASSFPIITNATPPESKRGAGRVAGPSKYPFDQLPLNGSFFQAVTAEIPNPLKTLGSAVVNATNKHRVDTGTTKLVTRTKRGEKNPDGSKIKEQVQVPVYNYPVKFVIRGVKVGQKCGEWVAPADGALITRTV